MVDSREIFQEHKASPIRALVIMVSIAVVLSITGCSDPYEQCMKEEKRRNAYLAEADYYQQSSSKCAREARAARKEK